jgi:murein DD-endopeptidase MepM/ murein hydrolase activator NlpD
MTRVVLIAAAAALVLVTPAAGDNLHGKKAAIDARISHLSTHVQALRAREDRLRADISSVTTKIRALEAQVGDVATQLQTLQEDLSLHQERLRKLNELYAARSQQLVFLRSQYRASIGRLNERLVSIYESDAPSMLDVVLNASSFQSLLDQVDYMNEIGAQDRKVAEQVRRARNEVAVEKAQTQRARAGMAAETQAVAIRTQQKALYRQQLVSASSELAGQRDRQKVALDQLSAQDRAAAEEIDSLQAASARIADQIRAAEQNTASTSGPSPAANPGGFQWPVQGPLTSPFGMRWGRLHPGIDIAVPSGTPVHASAAGTVIYAGWESGYGNFVVIDHGGGIATAYGHNTSVAVAVGQHVEQGQVIAYSGSTGFSTGPHVHFEVRVNGNPVDPLGYLG